MEVAGGDMPFATRYSPFASNHPLFLNPAEIPLIVI
jgi:hypothetical protein